MRVVGIIPARGGSKRLPRKNLADLGGKPLIAWTIDQAWDSGVIDELVVSSDDDEILQIAHIHSPRVVLRKRPNRLSQDDTPMRPVFDDVIEHVQADVYILLQPTSPFRTGEDIKNSLDLLVRSNADSVISVTEGSQHMAFQLRFANRLQELPDVVVENGSIYMITNEALKKGLDWYSGQVYGYRIPKERSLDIDNGLDMDIARMLVDRKKAA